MDEQGNKSELESRQWNMWKMLCVAVAVLFVVSRVSHAGHVFQYHGVEWETVGCYKDNRSRSLRHYFHDLTKDGLNKDKLKKTGYKPYFEMCADEARDHNYILFGIQYFSECWGDDDPNRNYAMNGAATNCHHSDVESDFFQIGGHWSNYIYRAKPIDGGFTEWGEWSECSVKCGGGGIQSSTRSCTNPKPRFKGKECEGATKKTRLCGQNPCAVDGKWGVFSSWSKCTKSCGGGIQERSRECNSPAPAHGGKNCEGEAKETRACGVVKCPVDGKRGAFSAWSKCTKSCGGGTQERSRKCNNPATAHGRKNCVRVAKETRGCGTRKCPLDGKWGVFSSWSKCTKSCGGGIQERSRECNNPAPAHGGKNCEGEAKETRACGVVKCPVDGKRGAFSAWSKCTKSCGGGTQERSRKCNNPAPAHGGKNCVGVAKQTRACGARKCPVDGKWGGFSAWSKCTKSCGGGTQARSRKCNNPTPAHGGKKCTGVAKQTRACGTKSCAVDGKWGAFSAWSKCTKSCGGGTQERSRKCNNPAPAHGGKNCVGVAKQTRICGVGKCLAEWKPMSGVVCTEGKGKKPAVFTPRLQGTVTKIKLVYKSGFIRCANNKKHNSNWGCWDHAILKRDGLNMVITDAHDAILLPTKFDFPFGKWYKLKGVNSKSKELVFETEVPMYISRSCPLKVWYGEDLVDHTTEDNSGKVCFQVYGFKIPEHNKPNCAIPKGKWAQLSRDPVCFGGKGKKPGEFSPLFQTSAKMLKLVHESGSIRCANDKKYNSYWGCWGHPTLKHDGIDVVITDDKNKVLLPTKFSFPFGKWYKLKGYNSKSKSLVFTSKAPLKLGGRLKIWYGEDLVDHTTSDNHGRVCVHVFVSGA